MAQNYANLPVSTAWQDLVATYAGMESVSSFIQNSGPGRLLVQFSSSGTAPGASNVDGIVLDATINPIAMGTAAHIWVRGLSDGCTVRCGLTD